MSLSAQTTAKTQKRHVSVLKSKYERYFPSGGTKNEVTAAAVIATARTTFFLIKTPKRVNFYLRFYICISVDIMQLSLKPSSGILMPDSTAEAPAVFDCER